MRQMLIQDIESPLNDSLGTPSHGCLQWRTVPLSGKLRGLQISQVLSQIPLVMSQG